MNLIHAIVFLCVSGGSCEEHTVRVEPKACKVGSYEAEVPINGEWHHAKVGIRC